MHWFVPFLAFSTLLSSGMFFLRLDGSPNYAMVCNVIPALINIGLDYYFIFELGWGMFGAALATSLGYIVGALMILVYLFQPRHELHFCKIKWSMKSLRLTIRNVGYMCRLGASSFLCEAAIATMMFAGNYVFIRYLGEDGVAAYSIACYFFPIVFMVYNAVAQSAQPILSYNYGVGHRDRVRAAFRLALITGLPLFASGFVFFGINIVSIGYFQSVERDRPAMAVTLLRGFVLVLICFAVLPLCWGVPGIWLAVPVSELLTFLFVLTIYCRGIQKTH